MQTHRTDRQSATRLATRLRSARCRYQRGFGRNALSSAGFSLLELLVVIGISLVVAAFAIPTMTSTMDSFRVRGALNDVINMANKCRMQAIKSDLTQRLHFTSVGKANSEVVLFVTDSTDANVVPKVGDAQLHAQLWLPINFSTPGLPTGGPTQLTALSMWGSNINAINVNADAYFNSRGMPCLPAAGGACTLTNGFVYYFEYTNGNTTRWTALSISPAGRIESWIWNGAAWGN